MKLLKIPVILYIGKFAKGKNVPKLIEAINTLNTTGTPCKLNLVGGGGNEEKAVMAKEKQSEHIHFQGKIFDKCLLQKQFENADIFAMPSHRETFGLVYIEAISQGLPIIYTQDEGIDGFYENLGEAVKSNDINSVCGGIKKVINNYDGYKFQQKEILANHMWSSIAKKYLHSYKLCVK